MKITKIAYDMKRSNGNYGSDGAFLEAELEAGDDALKGLASLKLLVDYQLNGERREAEAEKQGAVIADPNATEQAKAAADRFMEKYEFWAEQVAIAKEALGGVK